MCKDNGRVEAGLNAVFNHCGVSIEAAVALNRRPRNGDEVFIRGPRQGVTADDLHAVRSTETAMEHLWSSWVGSADTTPSESCSNDLHAKQTKELEVVSSFRETTPMDKVHSLVHVGLQADCV